MGKAALKSPARKRTAPKEERQHQLIQATIRSVAKNGMSDTTMATVSSEAGLSQGIINLHFQSKDRLLVETDAPPPSGRPSPGRQPWELPMVVGALAEVWGASSREAANVTRDNAEQLFPAWSGARK